MWKIAKNKLVLNHELIVGIWRKLNLERKIVFNWSHFREGQELVELWSVLDVVVGADQQIARHLVFYFLYFSKLVDVKDLFRIQVLSNKNCHLKFVYNSDLRFEFYKIIVLFSSSIWSFLLWWLSLTLTSFLTHGGALWSRHILQIIGKYLAPEVLELCLAELVNLFITTKHPVINVKHVSLYY